MTDSTRSAGPAGPPWSVDVLADLHAGVLDSELSATLWPRVNADPEARAVLEALDTVKVELGQLGHAPAEPMPAHYATRLDAALAAEARQRVTPQSASLPGIAPVVGIDSLTGATPPSPRGHSARRRRNRRMAWGGGLLAAAAAAVAVTVAVFPGQNQTPGDAQAAPLAVRSDDLSGAIGGVANKFDYGPLKDEQRLNRCLEANNVPSSAQVVGVRPVMLDHNKSGVLVLLGTGQFGRFRALVVGPTCDKDDPATIADTMIGR